MNKKIIKLLSCFIPFKESRKKFREKFNKKQIIICAGFGQSGNSCVRDFFKEFDNVYVNNNEDCLLKYAGGLLELKNTLLYNNNYYTADHAIKLYLSIVLFYKEYYNEQFRGELLNLTNIFINELIEGYYDVKEKPFNWHISLFDNKHFLTNRIFVAKRFSEKELDAIIRKYLDNLYAIVTDKPYIVLVNSIQNGNLLEGLKLFNNAKVITCKRDVRDVYLDFKYNATGSFIPVDSFDNIKLFFNSLFYKYPVKHRKILNIQFEDFVCNYDKTANKVMKFVGLKKENHITPKEKFNPEFSIKNVNLWKRYQDDEIVIKLRDYQNNLK